MNLNCVFFFSYKQGELSLLWRAWLTEAQGRSSPCNLNPSLRVSMSLSHYFMGNAKKKSLHIMYFFFLMRARSRLCSTQSKRRLLTIWYLFSLASESKTPSSACLFVCFSFATWINFLASLFLQRVGQQDPRGWQLPLFQSQSPRCTGPGPGGGLPLWLLYP